MRLRWRAVRKGIGLGATDGRNGGAERTAWETLPEVERFDYKAGEMDQGAITLVLDLALAFERVSPPVVWAWATRCNLPKKIWRVSCGYFEHQQRVQFEGCVAEPLQTSTAKLFWVNVELLLRHVLQDASVT